MKKQSDNLNNYTCALCKRGFPKPKVKYIGSFLLEIALWIVAIAFLGYYGLIIGVIFSLMRLFSRKKVCPHCGSENFYKTEDF